MNLYQTAEALSEAVLTVPAIFGTLASAYLEAVLGLFTTNTTASIDVASVALAAVSFGQQPQIVQVRLCGTFTVSIMQESKQSTSGLQHCITLMADTRTAQAFQQHAQSGSFLPAHNRTADMYYIVCRQALHECAISNHTFALHYS